MQNTRSILIVGFLALGVTAFLSAATCSILDARWARSFTMQPAFFAGATKVIEGSALADAPSTERRSAEAL